MASQGIQLPISLQISNLQEIADQMKQFANKNILSNSLGGKKIDQELGKVLTRLDQIAAKAKTALTTQGDFSSIQKDIDQVELGLNKIANATKNLSFADLKIPDDVSGQITALQTRIQELQNSLISFKGTQKEKLINNQDFLANLNVAEPTKAAKMLEQGYDELYRSIQTGMNRVLQTVELKTAEYNTKISQLNKSQEGQNAFTQWGALDYFSQAFKAINKNGNKNEVQQALSDVLNFDEKGFTGFKGGFNGMNTFLSKLTEQFSFSQEDISAIRKRIKEQATELKMSWTDVLKSMGTDSGLAKKVLFGDNLGNIESLRNTYASQKAEVDKLRADIDKDTVRAAAYTNLNKTFDLPNQEIAMRAREIAEALKEPQQRLKEYQDALTNAVASSPQLSGLFNAATAEINNLNAAVATGKTRLQSLDDAIGKMQGVSNFINRYVGIYAIVRKVIQAVRSAFNNIKELDKSITSIAVVTNMSQKDLWGKIGEYTAMAQEYGTATKDVYTVSQIFYQQGLQTSQVMSLTIETLKMAKIAGIDYGVTANAMTVAIRAFNIEMSDAQTVTDTYSALAAKFAVSSAEIANAMEKTASSASSVGMTLQSTSAFISVMEQTTRESAQNIGSALKSIISRYGEMKASPAKLLNVDGEEVAFNKVDTALSSIGISIKDASGQFRDFDDVIMDLAAKWSSLDNNTQRYIATIMAGNRQQSRFIALVSNYDELSRAMDTANNAENASIVQVAKTMDSLESKANQVNNAFSQLYLDLHIEDGLKEAYDWITRLLKTVGKLGTAFGALPTLANIIGFGAGTKGLLGMGKDWLSERKTKITVENQEYEQQIKDIQTPLDKIINIKPNTAEYDAAMGIINGTNAANGMVGTLVNAGMSLTSALGMLTTSSGQTSDNIIGMLMAQFPNLSGEEGANARKELLAELGVEEGSKDFSALDTFIAKLAEAPNGFDILIAALQKAANGAEIAGEKMNQSGDKAEEGGTKHESAGNKVEAAGDAAERGGEKAEQGGDKALQGGEKADQGGDKAQVGGVKAEIGGEQAEAGGAQAQTGGQEAKVGGDLIAGAAPPAADGLRQVGGAAPGAAQRLNGTTPLRGNVPSGGNVPPVDQNKKFWSWNGNTTGMKIAGAVSGAARILGTVALGIGGAHEDKSTDTGLFGQRAEKSKIWAGIGNGLSGAGTGASMGMAFGPWGAAIGAIGGFVLGGLGAILDGAQMNLQEQLALEKEEAKKASDEALKQQAKVTDVSSQLDNLQKLRKHMYDSTEDMQAYTDAMNTLGQAYPQLISMYDSQGNAIVDLTSAETELLTIRQEAAEAASKAAIAEAKTRDTQSLIFEKFLKSAQEYTTPTGNLLAETPNGKTFLIADQHGTTYGVEGDEGSEAFLKFLDNLIEENNQGLIEDTNISQILTDYAKTQVLNTDQMVQLTGFLKENRIYDNGSNIVYQNNQGQSIISNGTADAYNKFLERVAAAPDGGAYFNIGESEAAWEKFLEKNAKELGITEPTDGKSYLRTWMNLDATDSWTIDLAREAEQKLMNRLNGWTRQKGVLNSSVGRKKADSELLNVLQNPESEVNAARANKISTSGIFASLIANRLEAIKPDEYKDMGDWAIKDEVGMENKAQELSIAILDGISNWTDQQVDDFIQVMNNSDSYLTSREILEKFNIDIDSTLGESVMKQFILNNQEKKNRILKTIYFTGENGRLFTDELNHDLKGLAKFNYTFLETDDENEPIEIERNAALDIADLFNGDKIIDKYSDYFTSQLLEINNLAEEGYTELAEKRLTILHSFAKNISSFNSTDQSKLFSLVTGVDFSSYDAIKKARKDVESYGAKNKVDVSHILNTLDDAASSLVFNVTSLSDNLTTQVLSAAKAIDTLISSAKSGFTLDKAIEELNKINARSTDKQFSFDEIYKYDAALGKYVLTEQGLITSMQQEEDELSDRAKQLEWTAKKQGYLVKEAHDAHIQGSHEFTNPEQMWDYVKTNTDFTDPEYEGWINDFIKDDTIETKSWEEFVKYIAQRAGEDSEEAKRAQQQYETYMDNKKNQLYSQIDWGKLALGTDTTGTNKTLVKSLAKELGLYTEKLDETGKVIAEEWQEGFSEDNWEAIQEEALNKIYDNDEVAKSAAKAAIKGQQKKSVSDQISTAITEMLAGEGSVLSDTTTALLNKTDDLSIPAEGVLDAATNYVESAIKLYNAHQEQLLSIAERNTAYAAILTKKFEKSNQAITTLSSGASMDIGTLEQTFTTFGMTLSDYFDVETNQWLDSVRSGHSLKDILETDQFGKTRILNWNKFIQEAGLNSGYKIEDLIRTDEYQTAYATYVDGMISNATQGVELIKKQFDAAFSSITEFKQLNVSAMDFDSAYKLAAGGAGELKDGILIINDTVQYARNAVSLFTSLSALPVDQLYEKTGWTSADLAKNWRAAQTVLTNARNAWTGIANNLISLSDDDIANLMEKGGLKLSDMNQLFIKIGDHYAMNLQQYKAAMIKAIGGADATYDVLTPYQKRQVDTAYIQAQDALANNLTSIDWDKILSGTATAAEMTNFEDTMNKVTASLGINIAEFYDEGKLNISALRARIAAVNPEIGKIFTEKLDSTIVTLRDQALDEINTAMNLQMTGTQNQSEMNEFAKHYNELTGESKGLDELFSYSDTLEGFVLNLDVLKKYKEAEKEYLVGLGMSNEAAEAYIEAQTNELIRANLDISGFLSGGYLQPNSKATQELISQLRQLSNYTGKMADDWVNLVMNDLLNGGDAAVARLKALKGADNVTADEITQVFRARTDRLQASLEYIGAQAGEIVDEYTASIFSAAGATIKDLGNGAYMIESIPTNENWGQAIANEYLKLYNALKTSGGTTLAELNSAYAKILTAATSSSTDSVAALANAASMTYEELGEILTKQGYKLEDVLKNASDYGIEGLGAGKVQIADFTKFARQMGWDTNSPEYVKAFKTYNDSLIEMDDETSKAIVEEASSLKDAKVGDKINLTYLWTTLNDSMDNMAYSNLRARLSYYGAEFKNGILTIGANANIPAIIQEITQNAAKYGNLLPDQLAELNDVIRDYIQGLVDLINGAIEGNLKHSDAQQLQAFADMAGLGKLDFTETKEGLELSTKSAIKLYNKLKEIDGIQGRLVFDKLNESLKETNEHYQSINAIRARIAWIEDTKHPERAKQYAEELALAKEILAVRSTSEDEGMNFMSNKLPAGQQNAINYMKNWATAYEKIKATTKGGKDSRGLMAYEDFYNIITEMGRLAESTKQAIPLGKTTLENSEQAANLITEASQHLKVTSDGTLKVDLSKVGVDFATGANKMNQGVQKGINAMAKSQVEMLDGLIAMLELIVSMEQLGDIDIDSNNKIDWNELFEFDEKGNIKEFSEGFQNWIDYCKEQLKNGNKDLENALKGIKIKTKQGMISLADIIDWTPEMFGDQDKAFQEMFPSLLTALKHAAESGDWNLDNIGDSLINILQQQKFDGTIPLDIGNMTLFISGKMITRVDWESDDVKDVLKKIGGEKDKAQETLRTLIQQYTNGEGLGTTELLWVLRVKGKVKINKEGKPEVIVAGKSYNPEDSPAALRAAALEDAGFKVTAGEIEGAKPTDDDGDAIVTHVYKKGKSQITVTSGPAGIKYVASDGSEWGSEIELMDREYSLYINGPAKAMPKDKVLTYEQFLYQKFHYIVKTEPTFVDDKGNPIEDGFNGLDSEDQKTLREMAEGGKQAVRNFLETHKPTDNGDGTWTIDLGEGKPKFTIAGDDAEAAVEAWINEQFGIDSNLATTVSSAIVTAFSSEEVRTALTSILGSLPELFTTISNGPADGIGDKWSGVFAAIMSGAQNATAEVQKLIDTLNLLPEGMFPGVQNPNAPSPTPTPTPTPNEGSPAPRERPTPTSAPTTAVTPPSTDGNASGNDGGGSISTQAIDAFHRAAEAPISTASLDAFRTSAEAPISDSAITAIQQKLSSLTAKVTGTSTSATLNVGLQVVSAAKGTLGALAKGNNAMAGGTRTLMGELGPELVVSDGQYFVVGQSGAEFVDLKKDAIVFNHKQTERLLSQGGIGSRGMPFTNETNAISFAKGNTRGPAMEETPPIPKFTAKITSASLDGLPYKKIDPVANITVPSAAKGRGPAQASASAALAALKQLRGQWQSLAALSAKDLAGLGGGGGGGGGGKTAAFIHALERWYNYLQEIAKLEKEITKQEANREKISSRLNKSGKAYYKSQKDSLRDLEKEIQQYQKLGSEQQKRFKSRQKQLNSKNNIFSSLYTFDDKGQLKYKDGQFEKLSEISGRNGKGKPNKTPKEQYDAIVAMNPDFAKYMEYDSSGNKIAKDDWAAKVQAFWDRIDSDREEMQGLYDSITEAETKAAELEAKRNEILQEIRDNQKSVEESVLKAIEAERQQSIDNSKAERDALEKSTSKFIDGLSDALNEEQKKYDRNTQESDLNSKRRRLAILQRTGGSGSQIASLQKEIQADEQSLYFAKQQDQIDILQEAADKQLEKLDKQIEIAEAQLEFEKQNGLLWTKVYEIMSKSPEEITSYIMNNDPEWWSKSPLARQEDMQQLLFQSDQWVTYRDDTKKALETIVNAVSSEENPGGDVITKTGNKKKGTGDYYKSDTGSLEAEESSRYAVKDQNGTTHYFRTKKEAENFKSSHKDSKFVTTSIKDDKKNEGVKKIKEKTGKKKDTSKSAALKYYVWAHYKDYVRGDEVEPEVFGPFSALYAIQKQKELKNDKKYNKKYVAITEGKKKPPKFKTGGLVTSTGPAILHGSESRPEAVLNARQTEVLRNDILGSKSTSLLNLLKSFSSAANNISNTQVYDTINRDNGTNIGSISLNMEVKQMANDYDAKRAGEKAMEEMLRIARKSTTASVRR